MKSALASVLVVLAISAASAAPNSWVGGPVGDWDVPANWSAGTSPVPADDVSISGALVIAYSTDPVLAVNSIDVGTGGILRTSTGVVAAGALSLQAGSALQFAAPIGIQVASFTLAAGSSVTCVAPPATAGPPPALEIASGFFDLQSGATITVSGRGYAGGGVSAAGAGTGGGGAGSAGSGGGGGGHGGAGGSGGSGANAGSAFDLMPPTDAGGGGGGTPSAGGGAGGGVLRVSAATAAVDGLIDADGEPGISLGFEGGGGGAGGSIVVLAQVLTGSGTARARGGAGGTGANYGGGGGGGGRVWLRELSGEFVFHSTPTVLVGGGTFGGGASFGSPGSAGAAFVDPLHWTAGGGALASNPASWNAGMVPSGGERLIFGAATASKSCSWDLGGVAVGSISVVASFSTSVVLAAPMTVSGDFTLAGGTFTAAPSKILTLKGPFAQSGGRFDLLGSTLVLAGIGGAQAASFFDARVSSLVIGGFGASTVTLSGLLESVGAPELSASATLSLSGAVLRLDGGGPFSGPGSVNSDSSSVVTAFGASAQTWTAFPGVVGGLRVSNPSAGGLTLDVSGGAMFSIAGGIVVDTGTILQATGALLDVGGGWANHGTALVSGSTVVFAGGAGVKAVTAGASFDWLTIDEGGGTLRLSTAVVVASSVSVVSGTLDLAGSTINVRGSWTESPGAAVLGGTSIAEFDGASNQTIHQLGGNSFGTLRASSLGGVAISSTLAAAQSLEWWSGDFSFPRTALSVGGDFAQRSFLVGALSVAGSTVVFNGGAAQGIQMPVLGSVVVANASPSGASLSQNTSVESFKILPGAVFNGASYSLTATGPHWDTALSTYLANNPFHSVTWNPSAAVSVGAGSVVNAKLVLANGKTADLLGDLNLLGAGNTFDPRLGSTVVNAPGGSTIAFRGSADLVPTSGANWTYGGDAANSWLVFEGSGSARGASITTNTYGTLRVSLDVSTDVFRAPSLNLSGRLIVEGGTFRPANGGKTIAVGGDVLQSGGVVDFAAASTGTLLLTGSSAQTVRLLPGSTLWHLVDAGTAVVQAASDLVVRGDFVVGGGTFAAGGASLAVNGRVLVATAAYFDGQASTVTLNGASAGIGSQSIEVYGGAAFNGLAVNVLNASLLTSVTANVLADPLAGGVLAVAPGAQLSVADLRLGPPGGANLTARSTLPGAPWRLRVTAVSSVTAVTVSDSDASPGLLVDANDGRSVDAGGNVNWNFNPILLVLLPGETFTPGSAPGKSGAPQVSTAGALVSVTVLAVSSRFDLAVPATGTVTLASDDPYASLGASQALSAGSASLTFTPKTAEPAPRATRVTASSFFGSNVSTTSVIPAGLSRLQMVLPGQTPVPGSPSGISGSPYPRVSGIPFSATVRAVDPFWNMVTTVTDSCAFDATASSVSLPAPAPMSGGQVVATGLLIYSTGWFTISATDLSQPPVLAATSAVVGVSPPSVSSPTAAFYVPTGASVATMGGAIAGTAADSSSVWRVLVDVREVETGLHFDWAALSFSAAAPSYATTTVASPLAASTTWSNPIPDAALANGRHYAATALVDDPTGFVGTAVSTFVIDRSALSFGATDGQGTAAAAPSAAAGCEPIVATVTFTVGGAGLGPGGAVALRVPDGWTTLVGTATAVPPPAGYWAYSSTSAALAWTRPAANPAFFGEQTLGLGWLVLSVATDSPVSYQAGESIILQYGALPALSPGGRGPQTFSVRTRAGGSGSLAPIAVQPAVSLGPGTTNYIAFAEAAPLMLAPLQAAPTTQLRIVDLCGNDKTSASTGTATLSVVVPAGGAYVPDATAQFRSPAGGLISSVALSSGTSLSPGFSVTISTVGPGLAYLLARATFTAAGSSVVVSALRPVLLTNSALALSAVSVDTGTLSPGTTSVALSSAAPDAWPARLVFSLADPNAAWDAVLSSDAVGFSSPVFRAAGFGDPYRPIVLSWDGVDRLSSPPRFAPPASYRARIRAGGGSAQNAAMEIVVPGTSGYAGRLGAAAAGAYVRAMGPGAGEGAFARASATGYFLLSGLRRGQAYQLSVATATSVAGLPVILSTAFAAPPAAIPAADLGSISLASPARLRVAAILPIPSPFDAVGGYVGRAADGSAAFSGALRFSTGAASSDDAGPLFGRAASTWSAVLAAPGVYSLEFDVPDLRLSTRVASVTLGSSGVDLIFPFDKRANVSGWIVLPSTSADGTFASVQATRAGESAPAAFGGVFISSIPPTVGSSSGAYALYGLDAGTWTLTASAPGALPSSATLFIAGSSDAAGPVFALGAGGTIAGSVSVVGDSSGVSQCYAGPGGVAGSCPPGAFDIEIEALAAGRLEAASARARLGGSTSSSSSAFVLSGLAPGSWTLRASLPGFALSPAGGVTVAVAGASVSTAALTLASQDARLRLSVLLPPPAAGGCRAPSDWSLLGLSFDGADGTSRNFGDATALSGAGSFATFGCTSATFFSPVLPPGPLRAAALFSPTGNWAFGRALLVDGTTAALTLDLSASTTAVSGVLSLSGLLSISTAAPGGEPFTVAASSPAGVLSAAAGVSFCLLGSSDPVVRSALRAELVPYDPISGAPALRRAAGGAGSCAALEASTEAATSLGFAAAVGLDGSFAFPSGIPPGLYRLRVPGELDGSSANGSEAVEFEQFVTVGAAAVVLVPRLGRGFRVSGSVSAPASLPSGRLVRVSLLGADGRESRGADVSPPPGGAASFAFDGVADGRYALAATDLSSRRAFAAPPLAVSVAGADAGGFTLALAASATMRARLAVVRLNADGSRQAALISRDNVGLLPAGFSARAEAVPASPGAVNSSRRAADGSLVDAEGRIVLDGLSAGTYDVVFDAPADTGAYGAGRLPLSSARVSGVSIAAGQAVDLGVVPLFEGSFVAGLVSDAATGAPVAGLRVSARPSASAGAAPGSASQDIAATTDASGRYVLRALDPSRRWYDVTAAPRGALSSGAPLPAYAAHRVLAVDVSSGAALDFALAPAASAVSGRVAAAGGGALTSSLGPGDPPAPGAAVYLQTAGVAPAEDPLADLAFRTSPDGSFSIPAVATGAYRLTATAQGFAPAARAVTVGAASVDIGLVTLGSGGTLSGAIRLPDGSAPSGEEVLSVAASAADSSEFLYAALSRDPATRGATGYSLGGLTPGRLYRLIVSGPGGAAYVPPEGAAVVLASSADARALDLTLRPPSGPVSFRARREGSAWAISARFPRPLRARFSSDDDASAILSTSSALGVLGGAQMSLDRLTVTASYAPAPGETSAAFRARAALAAADWDATSPSARELTVDASATLPLAADGRSEASVLNGIGGALGFDGDSARVVLPRGAFNVDAASSVAVAFTRSSVPGAFAAPAPPAAVASAFYDVSPTSGAPGQLARPASLTLSYSSAVADASRLNLYWYNPAAGTYVLQPDALGAAPSVDSEARTVTVRVSHFSTYVLLDYSAGSIGGSGYGGGALEAYNFPNPFDLSVKTLTTIHGGGAPTVRGTLISVSVPPGMSGQGTFRVFDVAGRLIRTIDLGSLSGGQVYYQGWDGRNDAGLDVASGLYIGNVEIGRRRKSFKMAVIR